MPWWDSWHGAPWWESSWSHWWESWSQQASSAESAGDRASWQEAKNQQRTKEEEEAEAQFQVKMEEAAEAQGQVKRQKEEEEEQANLGSAASADPWGSCHACQVWAER